jgi:hypothetical protein
VREWLSRRTNGKAPAPESAGALTVVSAFRTRDLVDYLLLREPALEAAEAAAITPRASTAAVAGGRPTTTVASGRPTTTVTRGRHDAATVAARARTSIAPATTAPGCLAGPGGRTATATHQTTAAEADLRIEGADQGAAATTTISDGRGAARVGRGLSRRAVGIVHHASRAASPSAALSPTRAGRAARAAGRVRLATRAGRSACRGPGRSS